MKLYGWISSPVERLEFFGIRRYFRPEQERRSGYCYQQTNTGQCVRLKHFQMIWFINKSLPI